MIGICDVAYYIPNEKVNNVELKEKYQVSEEFIVNKTGFTAVARKSADSSTSDLCVWAFNHLENAEKLIPKVDFICVCTQNGDYGLPHTAAIVQDKLGISEDCASFDINLGCSGYVYSLHLA